MCHDQQISDVQQQGSVKPLPVKLRRSEVDHQLPPQLDMSSDLIGDSSAKSQYF